MTDFCQAGSVPFCYWTSQQFWIFCDNMILSPIYIVQGRIKMSASTLWNSQYTSLVSFASIFLLRSILCRFDLPLCSPLSFRYCLAVSLLLSLLFRLPIFLWCGVQFALFYCRSDMKRGVSFLVPSKARESACCCLSVNISSWRFWSITSLAL